mgnify:CR=1 FL=1
MTARFGPRKSKMSIVIEAEFVEVGKHQKVVTYIDSLPEDKAKELFADWLYMVAYPEYDKNYPVFSKTIRNQLRSFGWYIVKSKGRYSLMEEASISEAEKFGSNCVLAFRSYNEGTEGMWEKDLIRDCGFHIVWVPALQKRLIMRSFS